MSLVLDKILLVGDSITQMAFDPKMSGWAASVQNAWIRRLELINKGFSGYTTKWWMPLLDEILENAQLPKGCKIAFATVFLGSNDVAQGGTQEVSLEEYSSNLSKMVEKIRKHCQRVVVITPPPVDSTLWENRQYERTMAYRDAAISISKSFPDVPFLDTWTAFLGPELVKDQDRLDALLSDGLHLSAKGNKILFQSLYSLVLEQWPELKPESMKMIPKDWKDYPSSFSSE